MNSEWNSFLQSAKAQFDDTGTVSGFEDTPSPTDNLICDLSHFGTIRVEGEEARDYLQNQFTNDMREVDENIGQLSAYCSAKGRMLAIFTIYQHNDAFYLKLPRPLVKPILKRLQMFILRAKVTLTDLSDELIRIGVSGDACQQQLQGIMGELPENDFAVTHNSVSNQRIPSASPRYEICGDVEVVKTLWQQLSDAVPTGADGWELLDTEAGLPQIFTETVEAFVPQMVNLQLVEGVSFRKGCYPGQEVVARMQYLGKLKRRMYLAHVDSSAAPSPGDELFDPESESNQGSGKVVRVAPHPEGGYSLLIVTQISSAEADRLQITDAEGPTLSINDLPYPFEIEEAAS